MLRIALLLTCLLATLAACASESDAQVVKAEQLATSAKYEDAINILEDISTTVIGDPAVIKAGELTQKYYPQWCDALASGLEDMAGPRRTIDGKSRTGSRGRQESGLRSGLDDVEVCQAVAMVWPFAN